MCVAAQVANNVPGKSRASGASMAKKSTAQSRSFSSRQQGAKSSLRFVIKIARSLVYQILNANSRYTDDTQSEKQEFLTVSNRENRCGLEASETDADEL